MDNLLDIKKTHTKGRKFGRMSRREHDALRTILPMVKLSTGTVMDGTEVFGREAPLYLEIGFGNGGFLLEKAVTTPQHDFIGIEIYVTGISKLLVNLVSTDNPDALAVTNVRVFNKDAMSVLINNIPPGSLDGVYILFPDPWPKKKHKKRRLINPELAVILFSRLKTEGYVVVATDKQDYAEDIERAFISSGFRAVMEGPSEIDKTTYALKAAKGNKQLSVYRFIRAGIRLPE